MEYYLEAFMVLEAAFTKNLFQFNFQARTSRGVMRHRISWFVKVWDRNNPEIFGIGECAPLPGLSIDDTTEYEPVLASAISNINACSWENGDELPIVSGCISQAYPSIVFGLETALMDLKNGGSRTIFKNDFLAGRQIPINGLIWMADMDLMLQQISIKIQDGFRCIKMKVGGLNFEKECDILHFIRKKYFREDIVIRLDANGAFKPEDCLYKLNELAKYNVHSIEQPIKPGQREVLRDLSKRSPIPFALDEELIGVHSRSEKEKLLKECDVPYIILKPSLHGGLRSCREWIELAEANNTGWWMTSALESNVGLNAISQFTANYPITIPQGLGTGLLYDNNIESPLQIQKGNISMNSNASWNLDSLIFER